MYMLRKSGWNQSVLSLPIRNWNKKIPPTPDGSEASFESTYKELKHRYRSAFDVYAESFESTYKELKHAMALKTCLRLLLVLSLPIRNWNCDNVSWVTCQRLSFESTYKELKRHFQSRTQLWFLVLSLPIRNWNSNERDYEQLTLFRFESTYKELKLRRRIL